MVLRSMIAHCQEQQEQGIIEWPEVIQFETMSHCDKVEGTGTEWAVIKQLQHVGYVLVHFSYHNTHLVYKEALQKEARIQRWAGQYVCATCKQHWRFPYISVYGPLPHCRPCVV